MVGRAGAGELVWKVLDGCLGGFLGGLWQDKKGMRSRAFGSIRFHAAFMYCHQKWRALICSTSLIVLMRQVKEV